jgi:hypothetical protein
MAGRRCLLLLVALIAAATPAEGIKLVYNNGTTTVEQFFTHLRVESSIELPLEDEKVTATLFVPCVQIAVGRCSEGFTDISYASDIPGSVMVLNEQQYGYDPEPWLRYLSENDVKGIVLVVNEGAQLYRRYDPYTSLNISVVQVRRSSCVFAPFCSTPTLACRRPLSGDGRTFWLVAGPARCRCPMRRVRSSTPH